MNEEFSELDGGDSNDDEKELIQEQKRDGGQSAGNGEKE
jgi:hypothetical protein